MDVRYHIKLAQLDNVSVSYALPDYWQQLHVNQSKVYIRNYELYDRRGLIFDLCEQKGAGSFAVAWRATVHNNLDISYRPLNNPNHPHSSQSLSIKDKIVVKQIYDSNYRVVSLLGNAGQQFANALSPYQGAQSYAVMSDRLNTHIREYAQDKLAEKKQEFDKLTDEAKRFNGYFQLSGSSSKLKAEVIALDKPSISVWVDVSCKAMLIFNPGLFLLMPEISGEPLYRLIRHKAQDDIAVKSLLSFAVSIVDAYIGLHRQRLAHLDAHSGNVLLEELSSQAKNSIDTNHEKIDSLARFIDFGLARKINDAGVVEAEVLSALGSQKFHPHLLKRRMVANKSNIKPIVAGVEDDAFALLHNLEKLFKPFAKNSGLLSCLLDYLKSIAVQLDMPEGLMFADLFDIVPAIRRVIELAEVLNNLANDGLAIAQLDLDGAIQLHAHISRQLKTISKDFGACYLFITQAQHVLQQVGLRRDQLQAEVEAEAQKIRQQQEKELLHHKIGRAHV